MTFELLSNDLFWIIGFFAVVAVGVVLGTLGVVELVRSRPAVAPAGRDRTPVAARTRKLALHH